MSLFKSKTQQLTDAELAQSFAQVGNLNDLNQLIQTILTQPNTITKPTFLQIVNTGLQLLQSSETNDTKLFFQLIKLLCDQHSEFCTIVNRKLLTIMRSDNFFGPTNPILILSSPTLENPMNLINATQLKNMNNQSKANTPETASYSTPQLNR